MKKAAAFWAAIGLALGCAAPKKEEEPKPKEELGPEIPKPVDLKEVRPPEPEAKTPPHPRPATPLAVKPHMKKLEDHHKKLLERIRARESDPSLRELREIDSLMTELRYGSGKGKDFEDWMARAQHDVSLAADAVRASDWPAALTRYDALNTRCSACHNKFRSMGEAAAPMPMHLFARR